jgi:hypothetical protein
VVYAQGYAASFIPAPDPQLSVISQYEHLLHFFEGTAEFLSVILLSAFSANESLFESHKQKLAESMQKQNLSFQRATFGTWKMVVEYFSKQTRQLLSEDGKKAEDAKNDRAICADIFSDPSLALPEALSRKELAAIISTTNKLRNDWSGHGGVVGQEQAQPRNEQLFGEVQKLREAIADTWAETQLIHALHCRPRRGVFENEVAVLMGSNSELRTRTALVVETRIFHGGIVAMLWVKGKRGKVRFVPVQVPAQRRIKAA